LQHWREAVATRWQQNLLPKADEDINAATFEEEILSALTNDLQTLKALQVVDIVADKALQGAVCSACIDNVVSMVKEYLGIDIDISDITYEQKSLIADRERARTDKNWSESDRLREQLLLDGIALRDTPQGAVWFRTTI
jgi:cysteinyl-tRNA synthetase